MTIKIKAILVLPLSQVIAKTKVDNAVKASAITVSYTQLDVYKRQGQSHAFDNLREKGWRQIINTEKAHIF